MSQPLQGRCILVTRPAAQAGALVRMIAAKGGRALLFPLLEIGPADDPLPLQRAVARLDDYAMVIFISPNAIAFALPQLLAAGPWPASRVAAAIGQSSAAQLAEHGLCNVVAPQLRYDSEALLELPALQPDAVSGKRVLILRGNGGRELLAETLCQRGAWVDAVTCYRRSAPGDAAGIVSLLRERRLDALTVSSSEGLRNLLAMVDAEAIALLQDLPLFVPHRRIHDVAAEHGLRRVTLTGPADAGIMDSLCAYDWPLR